VSATWVAGHVNAGATNADASLTRIPTGSSAQPVMLTWNGGADSNDINVTVAARGSYVYTAASSYNALGNVDMVLIRWSSDTGAVRWARRFAGAADRDDRPSDVVIDAAGNGIVCGSSENAGGWTSWVVRKYSPAGDLRWSYTYDGSALASDRPAEMVVDDAGNIYVTGFTRQEAVTGAFTVKLSPAGTKLWSRKYTGLDALGAVATAVARRPGGGVYVGGYVTTLLGGQDAFLVRYTSAGEKLVHELCDANTVAQTIQTLRDIAVASDGLVFGVGQHDDTDPLWVSWRPTGEIDDFDVDVTAEPDGWKRVAADAYGGVYMTGPYDNASANPNIRTLRMSVLPQGGGWLYDHDVDGYYREVNGLAASATSVAVVGGQDTASTGWDQLVHIWTY
jgi:hypothetical protein